MIVRIQGKKPLSGIAAAPPSKSMAHRAVLCAALAEGHSHISHLEYSKDITATLGAAQALCAETVCGADCADITGLGQFRPLTGPLDCCESGSTLRFLIPLCSLTGQPVDFVGRGRLMERPQGVYEELFRRQGLPFVQDAAGIHLNGALRSGEFTLAGDVSSQFVSGLLLALPLLDGDSTLRLIPPVESRSYIDMTRQAQALFGVESRWVDENTLFLPGGQHYHPRDYAVEGDYSQAAFLAVLGSLCGGVGISGLSPDTLQGDAVILELLRRCGAELRFEQGVCTPRKSRLTGRVIDLANCPDLGPILMVLGLFCEGETTICNAQRLRIKESDRIEAMETELRRCGGEVSSEGGTITLRRSALHRPEGVLSGHNDHRVVMSLAVLALAGGFPVEISQAEAIEKSWPSFFDVIRELGAEVEQIG